MTRIEEVRKSLEAAEKILTPLMWNPPEVGKPVKTALDHVRNALLELEAYP